METLNNVNIGNLEQVVARVKADPAAGRRTQKIEGEWLLAEGGAQFSASINFEGGKVVFESDQPSFLGGGGTRPGPLHYCFFGLIACYTASFASTASQMGVRLHKLTAKLEGDLNFSRAYGLSKQPIMEEIRIVLQAESDVPREKLLEIEKLAYEKCPAVYALTERVKLSTSLEVKG